MSEIETRNDLREALRLLSCAAPQMRIGQLLAAAGELCMDLHGRGLWDAEDAELLEACWKLSHNLEQQVPGKVSESA